MFSVLEAVAVILSVAYLLLAARESLWCWYCAFVSSSLYVLIFWDVSLLMESALNVFYVLMAVLGWWQWHSGPGRRIEEQGQRVLKIVSLSARQHLGAIAVLLCLTAVNGWIMSRYTDAVWPYLDAFTTWGSVFTTFLVVRKVLENWLYWIVIDGVSIYLYLDRGLYLTALLFAAYVVIVVFGYFAWRRHYQAEQALTNVN